MNVLILTDLSEVAKNAGEYAMHFLADVPVNFYLLNIGKFSPGGDNESDLQAREELALEKLNRRIEELKKIYTNPAHNFGVIYWENDIVTATRKFVDEKKIDLIIMGAAKKGYSPSTIVGNLTYEVLRKVKCNLLIVPENCEYRKWKQLLFPLDCEASMDRYILGFLKQPAIIDKAGVTVLEIKNRTGFKKAGPGRKVLSQLKNREVTIKQVQEEEIYTPELLMTVQQKYDVVVVLGKSLSICSKLLHNKHGIYSTVANKLPILILHK